MSTGGEVPLIDLEARTHEVEVGALSVAEKQSGQKVAVTVHHRAFTKV